MTPPVHIVITTINVPQIIRDIRVNAERWERLAEAKIWIVGDRKTPHEETTVLARENCDKGLATVYLSPAEQDQLQEKVGPIYERLPWNNESRRNIGYWAALADGAEVLLSMDDDNFPCDDDLIGLHGQCGSPVQDSLLSEPSGFHNLCEHLQLEPPRPVWPRGYPFKLRGGHNAPVFRDAPAGARVGAIAGLWLQDPDIDATTWLNGAVRGVAYRGPAAQVLAHDTWTPINTQNTSVVRELIPAFLCVPMGWDVPGGKIQRYGDIWGGYFLQALLQGTPWHARFGAPVVDHRRNPHDYLDDLRGEYWGMLLTDWLVELLRRDFRAEATEMPDRVAELGKFLLQDAVSRLPAWTPSEAREFLKWTAGNLGAWAESCKRALT